MRAVVALLGPLPRGEGEKRRALFGDRISKYPDVYIQENMMDCIHGYP